jgi:hypothetical protein
MRVENIVRAWRAIQCGGWPLKLTVRCHESLTSSFVPASSNNRSRFSACFGAGRRTSPSQDSAQLYFVDDDRSVGRLLRHATSTILVAASQHDSSDRVARRKLVVFRRPSCRLPLLPRVCNQQQGLRPWHLTMRSRRRPVIASHAGVPSLAKHRSARLSANVRFLL